MARGRGVRGMPHTGLGVYGNPQTPNNKLSGKRQFPPIYHIFTHLHFKNKFVVATEPITISFFKPLIQIVIIKTSDHSTNSIYF